MIAFSCANRSGGGYRQKAFYITDIKCFCLSFKPLCFGSLERKTGLALALLLLTPPAPGRGALRSRGRIHLQPSTKQQGEPKWRSLLLWSGKRISNPSIFLVHNQHITRSIFHKGHSRDAVIMHSFASQCFRQRYKLFSHNSRTLFKLFPIYRIQCIPILIFPFGPSVGRSTGTKISGCTGA